MAWRRSRFPVKLKVFRKSCKTRTESDRAVKQSGEKAYNAPVQDRHNERAPAESLGSTEKAKCHDHAREKQCDIDRRFEYGQPDAVSANKYFWRASGESAPKFLRAYSVIPA